MPVNRPKSDAVATTPLSSGSHVAASQPPHLILQGHLPGSGVTDMHSIKKSFIAVAMLSGLASPALAQNNSASVNTSGSTTIAAPITLTQHSTLRFGSLVRPTSSSSTVTVATDTCATALSGTGNAALISSTSGCATYTVGGESGQSFNVSTDPSFAMTRSGGSETITVTLSKSEATGTIGQTSADFNVGGSFAVDTTTVAGAYTGTFAVTATYQ